MHQRNASETPTHKQSDEAIRLLKAVRAAAEEATFEEKRTIFRLLDVRVLYNGEMLELSGGVPAQAVDLERLLKGDFTGESSSPPPQSSPSADSPAVEMGTTSGRCTHNKGRRHS